MKMLHTCIRVMDLEKSLDFYQKALGLVETRRKDFPEHEFTLVYLSDAIGGYELELTYNYNPSKPYELGNGFSHLAVGVNDLEAAHMNHTALGYEVTPLKGLPGQAPNFYFVTDPEGYKVAVIRTEC